MRFKNLIPYEEETPEDLFNAIVSNKNYPCKNILYDTTSNLNITSHILTRFTEYKTNKENLENLSVSSYTLQQKNCLEGCYTVETAGKKKLVSEIKEIQDIHSKALCCYCGISQPTTIDHYLPKGLFPEFAVYSYNLIPCCYICNNLKDEKWKHPVTKHRMFINFYFDNVPNEIYLYARIINKNNAFLVEYYYLAPNNDVIFKIVDTHLTELQITNRLETTSNSYIDGVYQQNQDALSKGNDGDVLRIALELNNQTLERLHGVNFWQVVLNKAILNNNSFFTLQ